MSDLVSIITGLSKNETCDVLQYLKIPYELKSHTQYLKGLLWQNVDEVEKQLCANMSGFSPGHVESLGLKLPYECLKLLNASESDSGFESRSSFSNSELGSPNLLDRSDVPLGLQPSLVPYLRSSHGSKSIFQDIRHPDLTTGPHSPRVSSNISTSFPSPEALYESSDSSTDSVGFDLVATSDSDNYKPNHDSVKEKKTNPRNKKVYPTLVFWNSRYKGRLSKKIKPELSVHALPVLETEVADKVAVVHQKGKKKKKAKSERDNNSNSPATISKPARPVEALDPLPVCSEEKAEKSVFSTLAVQQSKLPVPLKPPTQLLLNAAKSSARGGIRMSSESENKCCSFSQKKTKNRLKTHEIPKTSFPNLEISSFKPTKVIRAFSPNFFEPAFPNALIGTHCAFSPSEETSEKLKIMDPFPLIQKIPEPPDKSNVPTGISSGIPKSYSVELQKTFFRPTIPNFFPDFDEIPNSLRVELSPSSQRRERMIHEFYESGSEIGSKVESELIAMIEELAHEIN